MNRAVLLMIVLAAVIGVGVIAYLMFEDSGGKTKAPPIDVTAPKPAETAPKDPVKPVAPIVTKPVEPAPIKTKAFEGDPRTRREAGIGGIVVTAEGAPVENAVCELYEDTSAIKDRSQEGELRDKTATTADGLFLFERYSMSLAERYLLKVSHPMFVTERTTLDLRKPESTIIQVVMRPGTAISGTVRTVRGDPVPSATVTVYDMNQNSADPAGSVESWITADPSGQYNVGHLGPGMKRIHASAPGYATAGKQGINLEAGKPLAGIDFALNEGAAITGTVVGTDGTPVAGAWVSARPVRIGPRTPEGLTAQAQEMMERRESDVQERERALRVDKEQVEAQEHDASGDEAEREAKLKRKLAEDGQRGARLAEAVKRAAPVVQPGMAPAPAGLAHVKRPPIPAQALLTTLSARTGPDGAFSIQGVEVGSYVVSIAAPGFMPPPQQTVEAPAQGVAFMLQPNARILGRVVDDETGEPVPYFTIGTTLNPDDVLIPAYSKKHFGPPKFTDGQFEYFDVRPGRIWLLADAPGYAGGRSPEITIQQGERREGVEIRLVRGATILGRVVDAKGDPIARAIVHPEPGAPGGAADNPFLRVLTQSVRRDVPEVSTAADGTFKLPNILSGTYTLSVSHPDFGPLKTQAFTVPEKGEMPVGDLTLARGATIRGRVRLQDGTPDTNAQIQVSPIGAGVSVMDGQRSARTDSEGMFEITGLAAGQYRVNVMMRNGVTDLSSIFAQIAQNKSGVVTNTYSLAEGEVKELDL